MDPDRGGPGRGGVTTAGPLEQALHEALAAEALARLTTPRDDAEVARTAAAVKAARAALVAQWDRLAWQKAGQWHHRTGRGELADYHAAAVAGLWEAALRFDPARGFKFSTYGSWYVLKHLKETAAGEAAGGTHIPAHLGIVRVPIAAFGELAAEFGGPDGGPFEQTVPARPEADPPPPPADVWAAVDALLPDPRQRQVLRFRFVDELSLAEAGERLGVSKERVRQIESRALARLRDKGGDKLQGLLGVVA